VVESRLQQRVELEKWVSCETVASRKGRKHNRRKIHIVGMGAVI
jgi:hypothetical protein